MKRGLAESPSATSGIADRERKAAPVLNELARLYPDADCALDHADPWQLLVATVLSAQSTDARVNLVTPELFRRFPRALDMAEADQTEIEAEIRSIGLFRNKARHLRGAARLIVEEHAAEVPSTMSDLIRLPGVARKTANVVLGVCWGIAEGIVVDTHVARLAWRLGLSVERRDVRRIEIELMNLVPKHDWIAISHRLIRHGRLVCSARSPRCPTCALAALCPHFSSS
ncbi:MAG: endonuclease III [Gemmatimonadetes bacterium]|nr:endonuclease III [Gemmatimonadota bacterium]